jgi:hypothetical protein
MCAGHHYPQANTNNVNKTCALLQTTGGKERTNHRLYEDLLVIKIRVAHLFSVLCSPIMYLYVLGSVL